MPVNGMNVGVDYSFMYFDGTSGALIDLGDVQNVQITGLKHDIKSMPYNNVPRYGYVPDGFKFEFTITRSSDVIERLMATMSASFNQGQVQKPGYLNESITNPDGSVVRFQYIKCVIFMTDHGNISRDKTVTLKVEGYASDKVQIA